MDYDPSTRLILASPHQPCYEPDDLMTYDPGDVWPWNASIPDCLGGAEFDIDVNQTDFIVTNTTIRPDSVSPEEFLEWRIAKMLWVWVAPVLMLIGASGNGLSFVILRSCSFRKCSIAFTLSALAIVDTSILFTTLLRQWLLHLTDFDVRILLHSFGCKVHFFLTYYLGHLSSWTLVVVTAERAICISMPFAARTACTKSRIVGSWILVALVLAIINSHFLWTARYFEIPKANDTTYMCFIEFAYRPFFYHLWYWIDLTFLSIIPFLFIIVGNIIITVCVVKAMNFRRQQSFINPYLPATAQPAPDAAYKPLTSSTAMLIGISILFLVTTTPSAIYFLLSDWWIADGFDPHGVARARLAHTVTNLLHFSNNALNFILYCMTGSRFRRAFVEQFRREDVAARVRRLSRGVITIGTRTSNCAYGTGHLELLPSNPGIN